MATGATVEVAVQLQASGTVRGRAFMPDGTTPIGLADVELRLGGRQVGFSVTSDSEEDRGSFSFLNVPVGDFQLDVFDNRTGRVGRATGQLTAQGQTAEVNVKLLPVGAVTGRVTANGQPVDHALVEMHANGSGIRAERMKATTDADGRYRFTGVPVGAFQVNVTGAPGGQTGSASGFVAGTVEPLADTVIDIVLEPSVTVTGAVRSAAGAAVNGARVTLLVGNRRYETGTNEQGVYRISYVPLGVVRVRAEAPAGYDRGEAAPASAAEPGATLTSDVTLAGTGNVSGTALNHDGSPLSTGTVTYTNDAWPDSRITVAAPVQSNGRYEIKGVPAGPFALKLTVANRVGVGSASGEIANSATLDLPVRLEDAGEVTGRLKSADGASPAVGADVTLTLRTPSNQTFRFYGHTDTQGAFLFRNVPLGSVSVGVNDATTGGVARYLAQTLAANGQTLDLGTATLDNVPVTVEAVTPADGATGVSPAEPGITVRFSEAVDPSTVPAGVTLLRGQSAVAANVTLSDGDRTATVTPASRLADLTGYTVVVGTFVSDLAGNHLTREVRAFFNTSDLTPPRVESVNPQGGAEGVALDSSVTVGFSEPLDPALDPATVFALAPEAAPGQPLAGSATLDAARRVLTFDPATDLEENTVYRVSVTGLRDAAGNTQAPAFFSTFRSFVTPNQGNVSVRVLGPDNQPVAGAQLTLRYAGAELPGVSGADGRYLFKRVPLGDVAVFASDAASGLRAKAAGRLTQAGQTLPIDAKLFASGSVSGTVLRHDGTTPAAGLAVEVRPRFGGGGAVGFATTDAAGRYSIDYVPVGDFAVDAFDAATGDRGTATVQIARNAEAREQINVRLNGQGTVRVTVRDANGQPVVGAGVTLSAPFDQQLAQATAADGTALFERVYAGGFTASANDPATNLGGSQTGTLAAGATVEVTVSLVPAGTVRGTVYAADGTTPAAGLTVRLIRNFGSEREARTGEDGLFRFDAAPLDTYTLEVYDDAGRRRARAAGVRLSTNGETATRDLTLVATGTVTGRVLDPDGAAVANLDVSLGSFNAETGGGFNAKTNAQGVYRVEFVPVGKFTATARRTSPAPRLDGETHGRVSQAGEEVTADIRLVNNAVTLPSALRDGNDMSFEVEPNGTINRGWFIFDHTGASGHGGFLLDVVVGGAAHRFDGTRFASVRQDGREVVIGQTGLGGLDVTRRVFVPGHGYFARYVEVLTNNSGQPVTFDLRVLSNLAGVNTFSNGYPRVIDTSSGDAVLSAPNASNPDRWVLFDDRSDGTLDEFLLSVPATAFVFDGAGARERAAAAAVNGADEKELTYGWNQVTLQPGESASYMHFGVQQVSRAAAELSAERLSQLPPEALSGLNPEELAQIRNFNVPADGVGTVEPLPALDGKVSLRVLASDGATPVRFADVRFQSKHPLYPRALRAFSDEAGRLTFQSEITNDWTTTVPVYGYNARTEYGSASVAASLDGDFAAGEKETTADLVFAETGIVRGTLRRHTGEAVTEGTANLYRDNDPNPVAQGSVGADGGFNITLVPPGTYSLKPFVRHGGFGGVLLTGPGVTVTVAAREVTGAELVLEPTGALTGVVTDATGAPVPDTRVTLISNPYLYDEALTDASGRYLFPHVAVREFTVRAEGVGFVEEQVAVVQDQTTTKDLRLPAVGSLQVQVRHMNGGAAANSSVWIKRPGEPSWAYNSKGQTDSGGRLVIDNVVAGTYDVRAGHPDAFEVFSVVAATLTSHGEVVPVAVSLPGIGSINGRVKYPDGTPVANVFLQLFDGDEPVNYASTDGSGDYSFARVSVGKPLIVRAYDPADGALKDTNVRLTNEGEALALDVTLPARATVRLTVLRSNGSAYENARVEIRDGRGADFAHARDAGADGVAEFEQVPEGDFTVRAFNPVSNALAGSVSGAVTAADHGRVVEVTLTAAPSGVIQGTVFAGDGQTPIGRQLVRAFHPTTGAEVRRVSADAAGRYRLDGLPSDVNALRVLAQSPEGRRVAEQVVTFNEARDPLTLDLVVPSAVVKGTVRYTDGSPVRRPYMPLRIKDAAGVEYGYFYSGNDDGTYAQIIDEVGPFTMTVRDSNLSEMEKQVSGVVESVNVPVLLDIVMPPTGTVAGTVLDASNNPATYAPVYLLADPVWRRREASTDEQGRYSFPHVPAGGFVVQAAHPNVWALRVADGSVADAQTASVDVKLPALGTVRGRVFNADGSPAAHADIVIQALEEGGPAGFAENWFSADASGNFEAAGIQVGKTRVGAYLYDGGAGWTESVVTAGDPVTADVTLGNGYMSWDDFYLKGADGFLYDVEGDGTLDDGGTVDGSLAGAYSWSYALNTGLDYPWFYSLAPVEEGGREIVLGPSAQRRLWVTRKVFSPAAGGFARTLDVLTNPAPYDITMPVTVEVSLDYASTRVVSSPANNGGLYAVTDGGGEERVSLAHVFGGPGGRVAPAVEGLADGDDFFTFRYQVTVPAGQTVILMHFTAQRGKADAVGAASQAQALVNLSDPAALEGMTEEEKALVLNFNVPQAQAQGRGVVPLAAAAAAAVRGRLPAPASASKPKLAPEDRRTPPRPVTRGPRSRPRRDSASVATLRLGAVRRAER